MPEPRTESRHPEAEGLHLRSADRVLSALLDAQIGALAALHPALPAIEMAAEAAAAALRAGGRMGYAGAGSSGLMALADCLELAGTFGLAPAQTPMMFAGGADALLHMKGAAEDDARLAIADLDASGLQSGDVVLVLAASGRTPYALTIAEQARARGVTVVGFANVPGAPLLEAVDIPVLLDTGPEMVAGSTRMGAATAQKVALNMLSVLVGIRLGHVHDGYMVNLTADNAKLVERAARIVGDVASVPLAVAEAALAATQGAVKTAILVAQGVEPDAARDALTRSEGHLQPLLK
ncbi:N-acetylmuramic acid 6-phosphate etherase [Paracoccus caeni]|uniref:N-acetylmuramic acid 6-phosphate etherase n=1 Tax=Paracoccus caeni TaxID=657651 RepID=A0A934SJI4_9RHOB|nr:N-acetylmuramic acid 6-phosphate etherase [Paracoccus caeni]MBK4216289.1 N-acetylmuramic acid 6-phosphate etherase [Paracoccus caeni]